MNAPRFYGRSSAIRAAKENATRNFLAIHANPLILLDVLMHRTVRLVMNPRFAIALGVALFAILSAPLHAAPLAPFFAGVTYEAKRSFTINPVPVEGGTSEFKLNRGMVESGIVLSTLYSVNVTGAGAAVRAYSLPVRRITVTGDNGKVLQSWRASDLIRVAQIWEQTPIGALLVPASAAAVANYTNLEAHIPLTFAQPRVGEQQRFLTSLPTFGYADLTVRIEWGTVADLLTDGGTRAGTVTFTPAGTTITQLDYADFPIKGNGLDLVRVMPVSIGRYIENVQAAVANAAFELDLGTTQNIRATMLIAELTSTGEPTNTIVNKVNLQEDNTNNVFANVPWATLRADNSKHFGLTMPVGVAILDFAQDGDAGRIYRAVDKAKVKHILDTLAVAGTVRAVVMGVEPPLRV